LGLASSAGVFGSIADMLVALYSCSSEFGPMVKWVDDFFVILLPHQSWTEADFMDYTARFGVPWSSKKLRTLSVVQRYIGFDWDLATRVVSLPEAKRTAMLDLVGRWLSANERFTAKEAAAFHGKLVVRRVQLWLLSF
jgi:hypothetical protein